MAENQRWIDQDPALSHALESLRNAPDKYQAQVALNVIKVIMEHQIESQSCTSIDDLVGTLADCRDKVKDYSRRWYDVNETLASALKLLEESPPDLQATIIPMITQLVEETLEKGV